MNVAQGLGFLTMAFGREKYVRQAENLAISLRRHMPGIPIALVTDRQSISNLFDLLIPLKPFSNAGTVYKIDMYDYSPFTETLFIDSDCIATRSFHEELSAIRKYEFSPVVSVYLKRGERDSYLRDLSAALDAVDGLEYPKFNGGIYFFTKGRKAEQIFKRSADLLGQAKSLGIRNMDQAGPGDETLISLALASLKIPRSCLYDDHGALMRTPLNITGRLRIEPLGGGCSFTKEGETVTPALCHFAYEWSSGPEYELSEFALRKGHRPSAAYVVAIRLKHLLLLPIKMTRRITRKIWLARN